MNKFFPALYYLLFFMSGARCCWAECFPANSYTTSTTLASCPSNGVIQITNPADAPVKGGIGISGATYTLTAGPASGGYQTSGQSANQFDGLPPGNYTVTISKPACPDVVKSGIVIASTYTALSLNASISDQCKNGPGGTITTVASGGKAPLEYAFVRSSNVNINDTQLTYAPSSSTSVTAFGNYVVRVRDACGAFVTRLVTVDPIYTRASFSLTGYSNCNTYSILGELYGSGASVTPSSAATYTIELFDINSTDPCVLPSGATPFQTITADEPRDLSFSLSKVHPRILVRTTSPCGESTTRCYDLDSLFGPVVESLVAPSCKQINGTNAESILLSLLVFTPPISLTINGLTSGTPVLQTDILNNNANKLYTVAYVPEGYQVNVVDACNNQRTLLINTPPTGSSPINTQVSTSLSCTDRVGAKQSRVKVSGGVTGSLESNNKVVLVAGPSGPISPARQADYAYYADYSWNNLDPGTYTAQILSPVAGCGPTSFSFTVPTNSSINPGLTFNLTGTVSQLCGGGANLTTSFSYNGPGSVTYVTTNSSNAVVATNTTGFFGNLPPDVYTVKATANTGCSLSVTQTKSFTLTQTDPTPAFAKQVGVTCESGGTATATGQAYFQITGFAPFRLERRLAGTATWTTVTSGLTSSTAAVTGLVAGSTYDFRLTDNCGKSVVTTVSVKPLDAQRLESKLQPCVGSPYTLSVPELTGASYSWTTNGQLLSTSRQLAFSPYQTANDGEYVATISLGNGCVIREVKVTLNGASCNQPLPVGLRYFTAKAQESQTIKLDWETSWEETNAYFLIQRSKDMITFETIARVQASESGFSSHSYQSVDAIPFPGTSYYRLKQVDLSGKIKTFPAVSAVLRREVYGPFPNPVTDSQFTLSLDEPQAAKIWLYTADGRMVELQRAVTGLTQAVVRIPESSAQGIYLLLVEERGNKKSYRLVIHK